MVQFIARIQMSASAYLSHGFDWIYRLGPCMPYIDASMRISTACESAMKQLLSKGLV